MSQRVLVVEDDELIRPTIVEALAYEGFDVVEAATGDEALLYLDAEPPIDVLFTDIQMPGETNGWEVAKRFREASPQVAVIYATGQSEIPPAPETESMYFAKPYYGSQIIWAVRALTQHNG